MSTSEYPPIDHLPARSDRSATTNAMFTYAASFDEFTSQMRRSLALNAHERLAISALWARGPMTMTELGTWIPLSRAAVTTLVDRLSDAGLVVRGSDGRDRRRTVVSMTPATVERMLPLVQIWSDEFEKIVAARSDEEWHVIATFLAETQTLNRQQAERLSQLTDDQIQALELDKA